MKLTYYFSILLLITSCANNPEQQKQISEVIHPVQNIESAAFQNILDSNKLSGSILIYSLEKDLFYSNDFNYSNKGSLPASTFKIVNTIVGLETGIVNDSTEFIWDSVPRRIKRWEQDLSLKQAYHESCVPCYQEVARKIGVKSMNEFVSKFGYGNMLIDSSSIDHFWLQGESTISQFEQIRFLKQLHQSELDISKKTETKIKRIMLIDSNKGRKLSGKTGWSIREGNNTGWFVGWVEIEDEVYFVATKVEPQEGYDMNGFAKIRLKITLEALDALRKLGE
jgi:beta-lactamase class D